MLLDNEATKKALNQSGSATQKGQNRFLAKP